MERQFDLTKSIDADDPTIERMSLSALMEKHQLDGDDMIRLLDMDIGDVEVIGIDPTFDICRAE